MLPVWAPFTQSQLPEMKRAAAAPIFSPTAFYGPGLKHTNTHSPKVNRVYDCNRVLTQSLLWVSVVCCASEMKAGLSNNSEFNTGASPLMRMPRAPGSYPPHRREESQRRRETHLKSPICVTRRVHHAEGERGAARPGPPGAPVLAQMGMFGPVNNNSKGSWRSLGKRSNGEVETGLQMTKTRLPLHPPAGI